MTAIDDAPGSFWNVLLPWRWTWLGWLVSLAFLIAGVPLFLRMPLWCDANLYDTAAYNLLSGGIHYRDVFDTNLPGFVAVLTAARAILGPTSEAARAVDLGLVAAVVFMMLVFLSQAGVSAASRAWAFATVASFYLFISEFNHLQRDVWMMLPVLYASNYRFRRVRRAAGASRNSEPPPHRVAEASRPAPKRTVASVANSAYVGKDWAVAATSPSPSSPEPVPSTPSRLPRMRVSDGSIFFSAFLEGMIWALAFWVKPHIVVMAVAVWLVLAIRLAGTSDRPIRRLFVDLIGVVLGGASVGGAGLAWLVFSGTWPHFLDVFQNWNTQYLANVFGQFQTRLSFELTYFPPFSLLTPVAVLLAILNLIDGRIWSPRWERESVNPPGFVKRTWTWLLGGPLGDAARLARALFSTLYLSWVAMALFLQREFHYAHVPEVILMIGLFALNGWAINFLILLWRTFASALVLAAVDLPEHPQWRKDLNEWHIQQQEIVDPEHWWNDKGYYYTSAVRLNPGFNSDRLKWWKESLKSPVSRELRNGVAFDWDFHVGVNWVELGAVEDFLRKENVKDGEVLCWHDSPHALYRKLGIVPGFRFMHVTTASEMGPWQYEQVRAARDAAVKGKVRFVVADLYRVTNDHTGLNTLAPDGLPVSVPPIQRTMFPLNQPIVFRSPSGRYIVTTVRKDAPLGECRISNEIGGDKYP